MRRLPAAVALFATLLIASGAAAAEYGYPVRDPYLATVIGTARADRAELLAKVPERIRRITRFPDREAPRTFFDRDAFAYTLSAQRVEAA